MGSEKLQRRRRKKKKVRVTEGKVGANIFYKGPEGA